VVDVAADGCVLDAGTDAAAALSAPNATLKVCTSTVRGTTVVRTLYATDSVFTGVVDATRRQEGCVRYSFIPEGSDTPRRFRCQPDLAQSQDGASRIRREPSAAALSLGFVATAVGDPAYFQLSSGTAEEILCGAEDGSEMGVWSHLRQPQRAANLRSSLRTYLRFGLEAGRFNAT
jgi:hypothetical protein